MVETGSSQECGGWHIESESGRKRIAEEKEYILSNWTAAKLRLRHQEGVKGSSTEGHVSHVLSSRISSRSMGWSWYDIRKANFLKQLVKNTEY